MRSLNIPYFDFLGDDDCLYRRLPTDEEVVVICAKGGSARMVAELLEEKGFCASYLEQGIQEWSQFYRPVTVIEEETLKLIQVNRLAKGCLSYMVISGGHELAEKTGAVYYISSGEMQGSERFYEPLERQGLLRVGHAEVKILAVPTPGHTPGSVSVLVNDHYLLSGDTIFVGGLGRPDLGGKAAEWAQALYDTVFTTIASLSDEVLVLPTHYADQNEIRQEGYVGAALGEIRRNNEVMRTVDRDQFTEKVAHSVGAAPPNYEEIIEINRGVCSVSAEQATELEIGPNRCALHHG
ncbi:MBL fold metallo-hydrolase [Brevibacillus borstelensis]|uniref:MBL fold metallo-hydrolase n=1 Tax=Brevibacillus borstelensis TaxID=45462 RepID=UPI0030BA9CA7